MAGHIISNRPVRVSIATAKKSPALAAAGVSPAGVSGQVLLGDMDPTNTTLFIGGLNAAVRPPGLVPDASFSCALKSRPRALLMSHAW
jgi:hypothetical protein